MRSKPLAAVLTGLTAVSLLGVASLSGSFSAGAQGAKNEVLRITEGGTPEQPKVYDGTGKTVGGIIIKADNVVVQKFTLTQPKAPGILAQGNNITVQDNTMSNPTGGDGDGIR